MSKRSVAFAALAALCTTAAASAPPTPQNGKCPAGWRFQTTTARDVHTGLATGKRMHEPLTTTASSGKSGAKPPEGGKASADAWDGKTVAPPPSQGSCVPAKS